MKLLAAILIVMTSAIILNAQSCVKNARTVDPVLSAASRKELESKLAEALKDAEDRSADSLIWVGRRLGYLGRYKEAVEKFTEGAERFPTDARFLRHRGHRLITLCCFDDAVEDLEKAARLIKGKPDEIEPDGLPNARNIPTSTLQSNIYYHLGLAYYLRSDYKQALKAYRKCVAVSKNPDMLVATRHWEYMTLRRLFRTREAVRATASIADGLDIIENDDYYTLIKLYKGRVTAAELEKQLGEADSLGNASLGYGVGNWYYVSGELLKALAVFRKITAGNQWASFGYIAAETDLNRIK